MTTKRKQFELTDTNNILIGINAGLDLTNESFMLIVGDYEGKEIYRRQMDGIEEYNAMMKALNIVVNFYPYLQKNRPCVTGNDSTKIGNECEVVIIMPNLNQTK